MRHLLDLTGITFLVTREAEPKKDDRGLQRTERETGRAMWTIEVCAMDPDPKRGGDCITITTAGTRPEVVRGDFASPVGLEAFLWTMKDRTGLSYRAQDVKPAIVGATPKLKAVG